MSLESAIAFYQALGSNEDLHRSYQQHCSDMPQQPAVEPEQAGLPQWQEEKILHFAADQGYRFSLGELYRVWFGQEDYRAESDAPVGWRMQAIAALNRQMGDRLISRDLSADTIG